MEENDPAIAALFGGNEWCSIFKAGPCFSFEAEFLQRQNLPGYQYILWRL